MAILDSFDLRELFLKFAIVVGALIIIYGVLWILANLKIIPTVIAVIFPQIVLIVIGAFIVYYAINEKNKYY